MSGWPPVGHIRLGQCSYPEGHVDHMRLNGECPWCGAVDRDLIEHELQLCDEHGNIDCGLCYDWAERSLE